MSGLFTSWSPGPSMVLDTQKTQYLFTEVSLNMVPQDVLHWRKEGRREERKEEEKKGKKKRRKEGRRAWMNYEAYSSLPWSLQNSIAGLESCLLCSSAPVRTMWILATSDSQSWPSISLTCFFASGPQVYHLFGKAMVPDCSTWDSYSYVFLSSVIVLRSSTYIFMLPGNAAMSVTRTYCSPGISYESY